MKKSCLPSWTSCFCVIKLRLPTISAEKKKRQFSSKWQPGNLRRLCSTVFKTVLMLISLMMALSRPFMEDHQALLLSIPLWSRQIKFKKIKDKHTKKHRRPHKDVLSKTKQKKKRKKVEVNRHLYSVHQHFGLLEHPLYERQKHQTHLLKASCSFLTQWYCVLICLLLVSLSLCWGSLTYSWKKPGNSPNLSLTADQQWQ